MSKSQFRHFYHDRAGNVAIMSALGATVFAGFVGVAILFAQVSEEQVTVQNALDAAVLASTSLSYKSSDKERIALAEKMFYQNAEGATFGVTPKEVSFSSGASVVPVFSISQSRVSGIAQFKAKNSMGALVGLGEIKFTMIAQAERVDSDPVCVLALNKSSPDGLEVYGNASFAVKDCAVQVNSNHPSGMHMNGSKANASASQFGVTGGYEGNNYSPPPMTGIEPVKDPYSAVPVPDVGPCMDAASRLSKAEVILDPGTYCGGLNIKAGSNVTLNPGVYIMKDGQFQVNSGSTVTGKEVMIALIGANSYIYLLSNAHVKVSSPKTGTYKNMQFMSDRELSQSKFQEEWTTIMGGATLEYDGVMYLPEQQVWVSGAGHDIIIKGSSPTMTMVADKIWAQGNAKIDLRKEDLRNIGNDAGLASFSYSSRLVR